MASFMNKALAYLGLKDIEDEDDYYLEDYEVPDEVLQRAGHGGYGSEPVTDQTEIPARSLVRPLPSDERDQSAQSARPAIVRPLVPNRASTAKVHIVAPARFSDAQEIGDLVKRSNPVIVNLQMSERDLSRRMIDFCSGLTYALGGAMEKVADQVFLLTPSNVEVSEEERVRLQERGLYHA